MLTKMGHPFDPDINGGIPLHAAAGYLICLSKLLGKMRKDHIGTPH